MAPNPVIDITAIVTATLADEGAAIAVNIIIIGVIAVHFLFVIILLKIYYHIFDTIAIVFYKFCNFFVIISQSMFEIRFTVIFTEFSEVSS